MEGKANSFLPKMRGWQALAEADVRCPIIWQCCLSTAVNEVIERFMVIDGDPWLASELCVLFTLENEFAMK